jgi:hypothetical protein
MQVSDATGSRKSPLRSMKKVQMASMQLISRFSLLDEANSLSDLWTIMTGLSGGHELHLGHSLKSSLWIFWCTLSIIRSVD